jgi:hypothetical protein
MKTNLKIDSHDVPKNQQGVFVLILFAIVISLFGLGIQVGSWLS